MAVQVREVTMASGGATSALLNLNPGDVIVGIQLSATFDGTALAIHGTMDKSTTVAAMYDGFGNAVSFTIADDTARIYYLPSDVFYPLASLKFVSNANQGATETILVAVREGV